MHSNITEYIDQSPEALCLTLTEGELDRTQFHLLSEQDCELAGLRISAAVIGASHIVSYDTGAFTLHEIFACVGLENVSSWSLADLIPKPVVRQYPGFRYEFRVEKIPWDDPEPSVLPHMVHMAAMLREREGVGLVVDFPQGELLVTPKTIVLGQVLDYGRSIIFTTAQSYPNVRGLVISHSILRYA